MSEKQTAEMSFSSLEAVRRFLNAQGYKVSKSTIDRHKREGKIRPNPSGVFTEASAIKYAETFLVVSSTGQRARDDNSDIQRQRLRALTDKAVEEARTMRLKREAEEGKYIPRSQVQQDLAARAMMLRSGFKHLVQSRVMEWVHLVGGDPTKAPELMREVADRVERMLSDYAGADSVVLAFTGPDDTEVEDVSTIDVEAGNAVA
jgi:hypothetical protein